jgi:membrane protease YdiL (CAAX protease family)
MKTARMWVVLIGLSVLSVLILNFTGDFIPGDRFDGTVGYAALGIFSCVVMWWLRVPTMKYWAKPEISWKLALAFIFMVNFIVVQLRGEDFSQVPSDKWVRGIIFLILVGFAEEVFSRGIVFGVLLKYGMFAAVVGSSVMFGLMHLNSYIGSFNAWLAYWHIVSAASFGVFACALMVATKSMWMPIVLHAFSNAGLLLQTVEEVKTERATDININLWQGLMHPLPAALTFLIPSLLLFWLAAGFPLHPVVRKFAIKWKLIEVNQEQ